LNPVWKLAASLRRAPFAATRSLQRAPEEPDEACWLAGEGRWLSPAVAAREKTGSNSSVNFDAASAAPCRHVFLRLTQFVTADGVAF
jgi:hypothetical protein